MITKLCIVCLSMTASCMCGLFYCKRKKARVEYMRSLVRLTDVLIAEVSFRKEDLLATLRAYAEHDATELGKQILRFCGAPYDAFVADGKWLGAEKKRRIGDFFAALGNTDTKTQILSLQNAKEMFCDWEKEERERFQKTGNIGLKLSVLLGLALGILIL